MKALPKAGVSLSWGDNVYSQLTDEIEDELEETQRRLTSLRQQVQYQTQRGRQARTRAQEMTSRRRDEAAAGVQSAMMNGAQIGLDTVLPGAGAAMGATRSVHAIREQRREGGRMEEQTAREGASTALGLIPVIGGFIGFIEDISNIAVALGTSRRRRTDAKIQKAEHLLQRINANAQLLALAEAQLAAYEGPDKATLQRQLRKARQRMEAARRETEAWMQKKEAHSSLPLTSSLAMADNVDELGVEDDDPREVAMMKLLIDQLRRSQPIFRLLESTAQKPYNLEHIYSMNSVDELREAHQELQDLANTWTFSDDEIRTIRRTSKYQDWDIDNRN